jgi:cytochrome c1
VANAQGAAGPPLERVAERSYLGGVLPNTRENMAQWIRDPRRFDPRTTMPAMGMTEQQASEMVAYLMEAK